MAMNLRDLLIDVCHPFLLMWADNSVKPKKLPGKADHHCQELPGGQRHLGAMPIIWLPSCTNNVMQLPRRLAKR
ncbi:hypothetical protein H8F21_28965 [Pseudomonas sp. P66]|uniref:Uncharacterized protein n=1 Tax=Pseudomonas arcuscaelestis TaxID=2710591 RepID=A0ABS2C8Q5_9PSED|nr:hypothetical protein [Pseudomonas arcuscaelestis]MBM5461586.1 hypothetical protein [Pseudomonas arcuscaelestis]